MADPRADLVTVPRELLERAVESLGSFCSDHGWAQTDMDCMDSISAVLASTAAAPAPEWRPIETAPKDGTWFIAFGPAGTEIVNEPPGCYIGHWKKGRKGWDGFGRVTSYPTHWMPLPSAPTPPKD